MNEISAQPATFNIALKEWGIVCEAIRRGKQQLLFRTGGIEETEAGFEPKYDSFWLFPTKFHQTAELVNDKFSAEYRTGKPLLTLEAGSEIPLQVFCRITGVFYVSEYEKLQEFADWHVLAQEVLHQRFNYRTPGLFVLTLRSYYRPAPHRLEPHSRFEGCKSWVELEQAYSTDGLIPITSSKESIRMMQAVSGISSSLRILSPPGNESKE